MQLRRKFEHKTKRDKKQENKKEYAKADKDLTRGRKLGYNSIELFKINNGGGKCLQKRK